jgi:2-methylisocitrate lyase-like PEP mutase family enzyme
MVEGGKTPLCSAKELEDMGYSAVLFANATLKAAVKGVQRLLEGLITYSSTKELADEMIEMEVRNELTCLKEFELLEKRYSGETFK